MCGKVSTNYDWIILISIRHHQGKKKEYFFFIVKFDEKKIDTQLQTIQHYRYFFAFLKNEIIWDVTGIL